MREPEIREGYSRLLATKRWSIPALQEALRQEWEIHYGKRPRDQGGLAPLLRQADENILILPRRVVKPKNTW